MAGPKGTRKVERRVAQMEMKTVGHSDGCLAEMRVDQKDEMRVERRADPTDLKSAVNWVGQSAYPLAELMGDWRAVRLAGQRAGWLEWMKAGWRDLWRAGQMDEKTAVHSVHLLVG